MVGIFSLSRMPWKLFQTKVFKETGDKKTIKIEGNPYAIKRAPEKV